VPRDEQVIEYVFFTFTDARALDGNGWRVSSPTRRLTDRARLPDSNSRNRCHYLLKTFYSGPNGWRDRQEPDGTVIWTSPTGHSYTTKPGGAVLFRVLAIPTGTLVLPTSTPPDNGNRGLMMPARRRTRAADRAARNNWERGINEARIAAEAARAAARIVACNDPPPF
jgi:hypothetical protein